jgi:S-adenosylmethionine synthetase
MQEITREVVKKIGYTDAKFGFDYRHAGVLNGIGEQSPDINQGVDQADGEIGAGDQGLMFGYACRETPELMPLPISLAHKLTETLAAVRKSGEVPFLRPDGKAQVSIRYEEGVPKEVVTIVVSTQHHDEVSLAEVQEAVISKVIEPNLPKDLITDNITYHINPTGRFVIGGPQGDAGLTGRKIIVDTYGGSCPHGGGAFSGKDPSKVDRSAAYMARYIAKNLVAADICDKATIQLAYAIGVVEPVSVLVDTHETSKVDENRLEACVREIFSLTPKGIIESLDLLRPIYQKTAAYGHFGRELPEFTWEKKDKVEQIRNYFELS